jgi:dihydrofolate reductase
LGQAGGPRPALKEIRDAVGQESDMPKLVARGIAISLDGYMAAPNQSLKQPFGDDGLKIMGWAMQTRTMRQMFGQPGGSEGLDDELLRRAPENIGATLMGRNMFSPMRGPWMDELWRGWWGEEPPYHHPVVVLTHHPRTRFELKGGTSFTFVTEGLEAAVQLAFDLAQGQDVRVGGGASCLRQCIQAGLLDELHLVQTSELLGGGEPLLTGLGEALKGHEVVDVKPSDRVCHLWLAKKPAA